MLETKTLVNKSRELERLLKANAQFREHYAKLLQAFERRWWTHETCIFFKRMFESLFQQYNIDATVHIRKGMDGGGMFEIEFHTPESTELEVYKPESLIHRIWSKFKILFGKQSHE